MQRHDKDKKCFAKRRSIMGYCRTNFGDFLMKINIDNVQILVYVGRNCISVRSSETVHAPRKSHKSDKKRQKATQQKTINGRNGYKKSQTMPICPPPQSASHKAPPIKEGFWVVVCMIGGTPRPWEGRIRGLRNSCGSAADMACGSLPCLRATNNKKGQTMTI